MTIDEVLRIHEVLISEFGGSLGLRDQGALEAALYRPHASFGGVELYDTPAKKAAAVLESVVKNHPFIDGNKRTGYVLMRLMLMENDLDIKAGEDEKYDFVIEVASGHLDFDDIESWIVQHLSK